VTGKESMTRRSFLKKTAGMAAGTAVFPFAVSSSAVGEVIS